MTDKTGGAAFPQHPELRIDGDPGTGMTLRDWFAGQALAGMYAAQIHGVNADHATSMARVAYEVADALLSARDAGDE